MYIRKEIREFINKMPKNMKLPKHWKKFVNENDTEYNLLIKHGKECECTNCGKYFYSEQVEGRGCWDICPFCNNQYDVRRSNLKNYFFLYDLAVIDNIDNKLVLRYFEVLRKYKYKKRRFKDDIVEYARIIPELGIELVNNRFFKCLSTEKVLHYKEIKKWRVFTGTNGLNQYYKSVYLENIDEKLNGTIFQYSQIKEAIMYLNNTKVNLLRILEKAREYPSFELLMKMKLFNLALNHPEKFNVKGNFEKRFGINKEYYNFMKENNISYEELCVLRLIKISNIKIIKKLLDLAHSRIDDLEETYNYVDLLKIEEYSHSQKNFSLQNYLDYIHNIKRLGIPITKKVLFPLNFKEAHDNSVEKVKIVASKEIAQKIKTRYKKLQVNKFQDKNLFIRPAKTLEDLKDEAKQQKNCVYKNYSELYANGITDIYFLRKLENPKKSLVTVEVRNRKD